MKHKLKTDPAKTFKNEVDEILDVVIKLIWIYTIFRGLFEKKEEDREKDYYKARAAHPQFFLTIHDSLLCGFCDTTALLFKEKDNETSIYSLIKHIKELKPSLAKKLREQIQARNGLLKKIKAIRHGAHAHRNKTKTPQEAFMEANLSLNMLKEVADFTQAIISELAEEAADSQNEKLKNLQLSNDILQSLTNDTDQVMRTLLKAA